LIEEIENKGFKVSKEIKLAILKHLSVVFSFTKIVKNYIWLELQFTLAEQYKFTNYLGDVH
jgi:hypothetical protein